MILDRVLTWLKTPAKPRRNGVVLLVAILNGVANQVRIQRVEDLERRITALERTRRRPTANPKEN